MDESYTPRFVRAGIHVDVADDCVCNQRAAARLQCVFHGGERTAEVGIGEASPLTRPAVVTWRAAVMWLRQNCCTPDGERTPKILLNTLAQPYFTAAHLHRRQKLPIRQHLVAFRRACDSHIVFNNVVIRCEFRVRDWPIGVVSISARRLEVHITQAIALPSPNQRSPSKDSQPLP